MTLRVGLIGAGMVAAHHAAGWASCDAAELIAVADPHRGRAQDLARRIGRPHFASLAEMAASVPLDAVDIVAPVGTHAALVREAVAAGLHVMCQKPLTPTAEEAAALTASLPDHPRVMVHENWRWRAPYRALKASLTGREQTFAMTMTSSGLIARQDGSLPALTRQPFFAQLKRLLVFEVLIHHLDTLAFLFGPVRIEKARIRCRCPAVRGEDYAEIHLTAGSAKGRLTGDWMVPGAPTMPHDTLAVDGAIRVDGWTLTRGENVVAWDAATAYAESYASTIDHFVAAVGNGARFETPASAGHAALQAVEEVYRLAKVSRPP
ncbi:MAG: Gfo/Idh/MocA family oxidoreductase [Pseudomonadota bacterium]